MTSRSARPGRAVEITRALLARWPLPTPDADGDKEDRGRLLVIAGSRDVPGAAILAAEAALRSGAGKVTIATPQPRATGLAVPEARVIPFSVRRRGKATATRHGHVDAVVIGPGMRSSTAVTRCVAAALAMERTTTVVLDAGALTEETTRMLRAASRERPPCIVTPHAGEMASMTGATRQAVEADAERAARDYASRCGVTVVLKGATTWIATPLGAWVHRGGNIGLATSGSGDTLAGIIAGLAARGASAEQAAAWGVALHALAGERLVARFGTLGILARDLPHEVPALLDALAHGRGRPRALR